MDMSQINKSIGYYNSMVVNLKPLEDVVDDVAMINNAKDNMHENIDKLQYMIKMINKIVSECDNNIQQKCGHDWAIDFVESGNTYWSCKHCGKPK